MFIQIHTLVSYPASLLNRDDAGLAKRIPFGNANRLRVSSQCQKRHWRELLAQQLPSLPDGLRTRSLFTREVLPRLVERGIDPERAQSLVKTLAVAVIDGGVDKKSAEMSQPVLFGRREADYFVDLLYRANEHAADTDTAVKTLEERLKSPDERKNLAAMSKSAAGLTAALFGRFVTSDLLSRVDAPVHVAHAFTVHGANAEMDYFTVVDDLNRDDETGAAHANQTELGAGIYYGYVVIDVPLLVSNLMGCEYKDWRVQDSTTARKVLSALIDGILRQSPGAKLGSTAPHAWADFMLLETGTIQPRALANSFLDAVPLNGDVRQVATHRLADYLGKLDRMYGLPEGNYSRHLASVIDMPPDFPKSQPVSKAIEGALENIWHEEA